MDKGSNLAYTMLRGRVTWKNFFDPSRDIWVRPWANRRVKIINEKLT